MQALGSKTTNILDARLNWFTDYNGKKVATAVHRITWVHPKAATSASKTATLNGSPINGSHSAPTTAAGNASSRSRWQLQFRNSSREPSREPAFQLTENSPGDFKSDLRTRSLSDDIPTEAHSRRKVSTGMSRRLDRRKTAMYRRDKAPKRAVTRTSKVLLTVEKTASGVP